MPRPRIVVVDNRSERAPRAPLTTRLIDTLETLGRVHVVRTAADAACADLGAAVVLSGSDASVSDGLHLVPRRAIVAATRAAANGVPCLGVCFGFQVLAALRGFGVRPIGGERRSPAGADQLYRHSDGVVPPPHLPVEARVRAAPSSNPPPRGFLDWVDFDALCTGVQFHPEGSTWGRAWLKAWLIDRCPALAPRAAPPARPDRCYSSHSRGHPGRAGGGPAPVASSRLTTSAPSHAAPSSTPRASQAHASATSAVTTACAMRRRSMGR